MMDLAREKKTGVANGSFAVKKGDQGSSFCNVHIYVYLELFNCGMDFLAFDGSA
jgi:hypothetical protein